MTNQHLITPPQDKFDRWEDNILNERENVDFVLDCVWKDGFQAGADQELEACCEWISSELRGQLRPAHRIVDDLHDARRPKPPTLKEQALEALNQADEGLNESEWQQRSDTIRRALEALPND